MATQKLPAGIPEVSLQKFLSALELALELTAGIAAGIGAVKALFAPAGYKPPSREELLEEARRRYYANSSWRTALDALLGPGLPVIHDNLLERIHWLVNERHVVLEGEIRNDMTGHLYFPDTVRVDGRKAYDVGELVAMVQGQEPDRSIKLDFGETDDAG